MGSLVAPDGWRVVLPDRAGVGRWPENVVQLTSRRVSRAHADILWVGERFELMPRGATQTWIGGRPAPLGIGTPLVDGAAIAFGARDAAPWIFRDDGPPLSSALHLADRCQVVEDRGRIASTPTPAVRGPAGWTVDGDVIADGQVVDGWRFALVEAFATLPAAPRIRVVTTLDIEVFWYDVTVEGRRVAVPASSNNELVYLLAHAMLEDAAEPADRRGFRSLDYLAAHLRRDRAFLPTPLGRVNRAARERGLPPTIESIGGAYRLAYPPDAVRIIDGREDGAPPP